jgi:hypothetical protein
MKRYAEDDEMYMLCVMVITGLLSAHPTLVGAARRLVPTDLCELLTVTMRSQCSLQLCSQSRAWTHFSFPYVCRVCVVHCTAVYCCLTCDPAYSAPMLERFRQQNFHGMLQSPPPYIQDGLTLETAVVLPGVGAGEPLLPGQKDTARNQQASTALVPVLSTAQGGSTSAIRDEPLSAEADARQKMMVAGVFHTAAGAPTKPYQAGISSATMVTDDYAGCTRNVDYVAYMARKEKDHIMSTLFALFNIY